MFFFFKQKTAYEMRISDWSSDVCSSDLGVFRSMYGVSGQPYPTPDLLKGGVNLGFMYLPIYRAWVVVASILVCLVTWFVIEKTRLGRSEEHTSELQSLMRISYAVFCLNKKIITH